MAAPLFLLILSSLSAFLPGASSADFTLLNLCNFMVWPASQSAAFAAVEVPLPPASSISFSAPSGSSGMLWPRTRCDFDATSGRGKCLTGDCGGGRNCVGKSAEQPFTLARFDLSPDGGPDKYGVSLEHGYNVALKVQPIGGGTGDCSSAGCISDLNPLCPEPLRVSSDSDSVVGCINTCSTTCPYFGVFNDACPYAKIYPYDGASTAFTCAGSNYQIIFCPAAF